MYMYIHIYMCVCVCVCVGGGMTCIFFIWKHLCLFSHIINISLVMYCVFFFTTIKTKRYLLTCVCLVRVEISDIRPVGRCW